MSNNDLTLIFGCGIGGHRAFDAIQQKESIIGFLDNDQDKQGGKFCNLPVYSPTKLRSLEYNRILIASQYKDSICEQLLEMGIPLSKIEFAARHILLGGQSKASALKKFCMTSYLSISACLISIQGKLMIKRAIESLNRS